MKIAGHHENASPDNKKRTTGDTGDKGFFAVDVRCLAHACKDANMAAAYLVMACGTGFDHVTTAWSVNAIETYTGLSRTRAKAAIEGLIRDRLVSRVKGSKSRYKLATWAQFNRQDHDPRGLAEAQIEVLEIIGRDGPLTQKQQRLVPELIRMRRVCRVNGALRIFEPPAPEFAFIPNAFVTSAEDEAPPVERLRRLRDAGLFRLIVDLYQIHLADDFGIAKTVFFKRYDQTVKAEVGPYRILEFKPHGPVSAYPHKILEPHCRKKADGQLDGAFVFSRLEALKEIGLIEWIPTLFEASDPEAEPLFPLGIGGGNSLDDRLGSMAHTAAASLLARFWNLDAIPSNLEGPSENMQLVALPKAYSYRDATMVGIAQLRYRPHTQRTREWLSKVEKRSAEHLETWNSIVKKTAHARMVAA